MAVAVIEFVQPRAETALAASPVHELRGVRVEQRGELLVLSGAVSSYYHKQLAQEAVRSVCREVELVNDICVAAHELLDESFSAWRRAK